ncbi:MAG: preprotein translocase subunit SecE [Erysipelotrichaceae bacterium]|nr:preprotein translocase subunit SecE [Erysipelotrichaceae bacterium]
MGIRKYTKEVVKEARRVRWPKREKLISLVSVVIVVVIIAALVLVLEDIAAGYLLGGIEDAFKSIGN